ncbi:MAG: hypothetical protein LC754_01160 [Acidobacteria bacterium]|nr:hypothetical protein [Acidobacteriota bacterium]
MKRILVVSIAVALCALCLTSPQSNMNAASNKEVRTNILVPKGMPVSVEAAGVTTSDGRGLSRLNISVTNESDGDLSGLRLAVFIVSLSGHTKAGEGLKEEVNLPAHSAKAFSATLRSSAIFGDRAVVAVQGVTGEAGTWEVSLADVFSSALAKKEKDMVIPPAQRISQITGQPMYIKAAAVQGTYCRDALNNAKTACSAGLESFSCDEKNQTFSFTCRTPQPGT